MNLSYQKIREKVDEDLWLARCLKNLKRETALGCS